MVKQRVCTPIQISAKLGRIKCLTSLTKFRWSLTVAIVNLRNLAAVPILTEEIACWILAGSPFHFSVEAKESETGTGLKQKIIPSRSTVYLTIPAVKAKPTIGCLRKPICRPEHRSLNDSKFWAAARDFLFWFLALRDSPGLFYLIPIEHGKCTSFIHGTLSKFSKKGFLELPVCAAHNVGVALYDFGDALGQLHVIL